MRSDLVLTMYQIHMYWYAHQSLQILKTHVFLLIPYLILQYQAMTWLIFEKNLLKPSTFKNRMWPLTGLIAVRNTSVSLEISQFRESLAHLHCCISQPSQVYKAKKRPMSQQYYRVEETRVWSFYPEWGRTNRWTWKIKTAHIGWAAFHWWILDQLSSSVWRPTSVNQDFVDFRYGLRFTVPPF